MQPPNRRRRAAGAVLLAVAVGVVGVPARVSAARHRPALVDSDGDGLPDAWERHGVTVDGPAGPRFIDLPAMGADPNRPDVFLQVDWMADDQHDQRPAPDALAMVVEAFARSPYVSPTGSVGIALHVDAGPGSTLAPGRTWDRLSRARALPWRDTIGSAASRSYDWTEFLRIKAQRGGFLSTGRGAVFHYAIFAHYHDRDDPRGSGASGIARGIGGTDLLVTLGNFTDGVGTPREQAGALMHELGHNLGLRHGGCDDQNYKSGYASVMNYSYQMTGITRGGVQGILDFSRGAEPLLDDALADAGATPVAGGAETRADACVTTGEARAGLAAVPPPAGAAPAVADPDDCSAGEPFDDWAHVTLAVGGIGNPGRPSKR